MLCACLAKLVVETMVLAKCETNDIQILEVTV